MAMCLIQEDEMYRQYYCTGMYKSSNNIILTVIYYVTLHSAVPFCLSDRYDFFHFQNECILKRKTHSCTPKPSTNQMTLEMDKLKKTVQQNSHEPIPKLYENACESIRSTGLDLVAEIPALSSIQHSLYDIRNKSLEVKKTIFKNFAEITVPAKFSDFLLANYYDENKRILIFSSNEARDQIGHIDEYFGDATFDCCPYPFSQLFIIHGETGSGITETAAVPLIYALMPDKKEETYITVLQLIKSQLPTFKPKKYHCDFEIAEINAFRKEFPSVNMKGCYYHWCKAVWKKSKKLKIKSKYDKRIVGLTASLPLLPAEHIEEGLDYAKLESRGKEKLKLFFRYIDRFWMTKKFNNILCVFGERHRTNNIAETFHSKLQREINKRNTSLLRLLVKLKDIESKVKFQTKKRRKIYIENDDDIMYFQLQLLNNELSVGYVLEKLR